MGVNIGHSIIRAIVRHLLGHSEEERPLTIGRPRKVSSMK